MSTYMVILGAGGFAREASLLVEEINRWAGRKKWVLMGFIDEDEAKWGKNMRGYRVLGGFETLAEMSENVKVISVVGDPVAKQRLVAQAEERGKQFVNLIHPQVNLAEDVSLGKGVLINKGCLLTTNINICDHVSINPGCGIGHDVTIGSFSTLMWRVNLSGAVKVGKECLIGTGATVLQEKTIGDNCTIGAGAVVTKDVAACCTVVGVPAREKK